MRPNSNKFKGFFQEAHNYTKYCHEKNIKKVTVESQKTSIPKNREPGFETSYFKKWRKNDGEDTV